MKDILQWAAMHVTIWVTLFTAFVLGHQGALNILAFFVCAMGLLSPFLLGKDSAKRAAALPPRPWQRGFNLVQSWTMLGTLVWFGHVWLGALWAVAMLFGAVHRDAVDKARKENHAPEAAPEN